MEINEPEAEIVRSIFKDFAEHNSIVGIVKRLNKDNILGRNKKPCKWSTSTIHRMLKNTKYIGTWPWNRTGFKRDPLTGKPRVYNKPKNEWIIKEVPNLRIVPDELWNQVQARFKVVRRVFPEGKGRGFIHARGNAVSLYPRELFSGAMRCGTCGAAFVKTCSRHAGYYGCHRAVKQGCSNHTTVRKDVFERVMINAITRELLNEDNLFSLAKRVETEVNYEFRKSPEEMKRLEAEHKKVMQRLNHLVEYVAEAAIRFDRRRPLR